MNVTELARRLNIPTQELRDLLPEFGYDIGQRAIKVDEKIAHEIIQNWGRLMADYQKKLDYEKLKQSKEEVKEEVGEKQDIEVPQILTVKEFAAILSMPINKVIGELMKNGIMASLNERIDYDTAAIVASDLGFNVLAKDNEADEIEAQSNKLKEILEEQKVKGTERPPVIVIMGHVDHGKTKLLDTIRKTNVIDTESGGITQHIGAYQVEKNGRLISFIDTPGHEAFTAMRSRGAKVADIAILIVAADDSVKPQTVEALRIIQNAHIPMLVAINKIDKPEANIDKVKKDLSQYNLIPEDWGGKTIMAPISALSGDGIDDLLDMILLTADMHKEDLVADPNRLAAGTIIESHVDKGEGIVSTVLVQTGTLKVGDIVSINGNYYGKIRTMKDYTGSTVEEALPSTPVKIIGLKIQPKVGDLLEVPESEKKVSKKIKKYDLEKEEVGSILLKKSQEEKEKDIKTLPIVLKADVLGSLEAIIESLEKIESEFIKVNIVSKGLGNITENDINMAETSGGLLIGFNVVAPPQVAQMAGEKEIEILSYKIIYELIEKVKQKMEEDIGEEIVRRDFGKMKVLAIFKTEKKAMILGCRTSDGVIEFKPKEFATKVTVTRDGEYITEGLLDELQCGKQLVTDVQDDQECGIRFVGNPIVQIGDVLEFFTEEKKKRVL